MSPYRIVLADDHALLRQGVKKIIEGAGGVLNACHVLLDRLVIGGDIRDRLADAGIQIEDGADGTRWRRG